MKTKFEMLKGLNEFDRAEGQIDKMSKWTQSRAYKMMTETFFNG